MYLEDLGQPGQPGATYLYAHARTGMFLPLLDTSKVNNGKAMLGKLVQVYTNDDMLYLYEIYRGPTRHSATLDAVFAGDRGRALAPDLRGPARLPGSSWSSPGRCRAGPATTDRGRPEGKAGRLRLTSRPSRRAGRPTSDPVDPAQDDGGDDRRHRRSRP